MRLPTEQEQAGLRQLCETAHRATCAGIATHTEEQIEALEAADAWIEQLLQELAARQTTEWEVALEDGCGGCPAGGYAECLVSPISARIATPNNHTTPNSCPLRNGSVLLVAADE